MRTSPLLAASILALTACTSSHRGDRGPPPDLGATESGIDAGPHDMSADLPVSFHCVSDSTCDDHLFCTGVELCQPGNPAADANGCVRGPSACAAGLDCSETTHGCTVIPDGGPPGDVRSTISYVDPDTMVRMRLPVPTTVSGTTPDTTCFGTARRPSSTGAPTTLSFTVIDFQNLWPADSVGVDWFTDDVLPAGLACGAGCTASTVSASGTVSVTAVPGAWMSYASHAHTGADMAHSYVPTIAAHRAATSASEHYVVSQQTLSLVPTLLGLHRATGTSILLGGITDCAGEPVGGLVVRVFRTDGTLVVEPPEGTPGSASLPAYRYFGDTGLPSSSQYFTNSNNGLYAGVNLPPSTPIRVEAWEDDGVTARLWSCEEILTSADAVSFLDMGPYRSDGPTGCTETRP